MSTSFVLGVGVAGVIAGVAIAKHLDIDTPGQNFGAALHGRQMVIAADGDNRCFIDGTANGAKFRFLLDSGAAGIFFSIRDARRLGLDPARLSFDHGYQGWGWKVKGATVRLRSLEVAGLVLNNVDAAIDRLGSVTDTTGPLLGGSVFKSLNFQVRDGICVLTLPRRAPGKTFHGQYFRPDL